MNNALCGGKIKALLRPGDTFKGFHSGDSGGPLTIVSDNGAHTLIGVVSAGPEDEAEYKENPSFLFSKVNQFLPWLFKTTKGGLGTFNIIT